MVTRHREERDNPRLALLERVTLSFAFSHPFSFSSVHGAVARAPSAKKGARNQQEVVKSMASSMHSAAFAFLNSNPPASPVFLHGERGVRTSLLAWSVDCTGATFIRLVSPHLQVLSLFYPGNEERERRRARSRKERRRGRKKKTLRRHCLLTLSSRFSQLHEYT